MPKTKRNIFNFNKPRTPTEWLIFIAATGVILTSPVGTRKFLSELNKYLNDKGNNKIPKHIL